MQILALDRTQSDLPLKRGRGRTMTRDYKRNGVTTLFAALNMLDGKVLSMTEPLHRHQGWMKLLNWKYVSPLDSFYIGRGSPSHYTRSVVLCIWRLVFTIHLF